MAETMPLPSVEDGSKRRFFKENQRTAKRRETFTALQDSREDLFAGEWDGYVITFH
jgi:hypothetical protein